MDKKKMLVVEKYTSYEYSKLNGNIKNIDSLRLLDIQKSHDEHKQVRKNILSVLDRHGVLYDLIHDDEVLNVKYSDYLYVLSLGGDGTVLHASSRVSNQLFFAVNTDLKKSVGYLTKLNLDNFEKALVGVLKGDFKFEEFNRLSARINGKKLSNLALNEILVGDSRIYKTSHLDIEIDGRCTRTISNGIIFSTRQGSYAFYKSSGAKPFNSEKIGYNVIMPYKISLDFKRSGLVLFDSKILVKPKREHYNLLFDCREKEAIVLKQGDVVEICVDKKDALKMIVV